MVSKKILSAFVVSSLVVHLFSTNLARTTQGCIRCTSKFFEFIKAKNVLFKIAMDIKEGILTVTSTLRAVFTGAYNKAVELSNMKQSKSLSIEETPANERPIPFYNWLNERDSHPQSIVHDKPSLENWLE
ncbi:hypothetical protein MHB40_16950 [Lysinibacillus sp. FSL K6-0057]|uniref:hypothetical protein n=1 Tax=Lysinibacillus sp. FSL K6-0057 TaxID=2921411 RepID=UPI00315ACA81